MHHACIFDKNDQKPLSFSPQGDIGEQEELLHVFKTILQLSGVALFATVGLGLMAPNAIAAESISTVTAVTVVTTVAMDTPERCIII